MINHRRRANNAQANSTETDKPASSTRTRVISAVIGAPFVIAAALWPGTPWTWPFAGWPFAVLVLALVMIGLHEFYEGCRSAGLRPRDFIGYAAGVVFLLYATPLSTDHPNIFRFGLTSLVMLSLAAEVFIKKGRPLRSLPATWLGIFYVAWLFPYAVRIRVSTPHLVHLPQAWIVIGEGAWLLLYTMLTTSAVDTGAYFAGTALGRHKLAPDVSPGKTWEGSVGGFLAAVLVGWAGHLVLGLPLTFALASGAAIGVMAQLGDLSKSKIKREIGIKDFGSLIPGHGGVLDRFDSLLFTAPTVYWLATWIKF
jgi:phosphatidate cytidylyltransferase